jgi:hypothetical protein
MLFILISVFTAHIFHRNSSYTELTGANDEEQHSTDASLDQPILQVDAVLS